MFVNGFGFEHFFALKENAVGIYLNLMAIKDAKKPVKLQATPNLLLVLFLFIYLQLH